MIDLWCIIVIIIAIVILILLIYKTEDSKKIFKIKRVYFSISLVCSISSVLIINMIPKAEAIISDADYQLFSKYNSSKVAEIKKLGLNKVIIVGDSRMAYIERDKENLDIPDNFIFDAKSGASVDWTKKTAIPKLKEILKANEDYNCHVIFNMGVNDLNTDKLVKEIVDDYFEIYETIIKQYDNVEFYFLSVNPVDEVIINELWDNKRTNKKIESFNTHIIKYLDRSMLNNVSYCDSYHNLTFNLPDGLHYDNETNQKILEYIKNECIIYK